MRYTAVVATAQVPLVQPVISKLPSHYVKAYIAKTEDGTVQYDKPTRGAVETMLPVGRLATLTPYATEEGVRPAWYVLDGEFNDEQLGGLKTEIKKLRLTRDMLQENVRV